LEGKYYSKDACFNSGGNVGIGTSDPLAKLSIKENGQYLNFITNKKLAGSWPPVAESITMTIQSSGNVAGNLAFATGNSEAMRIVGNGNVGIGTTTPAGKLDVNGAVFLKGKSIRDSDGANSYFKSNAASYFENMGSVSAMITASGNFGIGTTDPKNKLSVNGTIWAKEVKVSLTDAADWVFDTNYKLKPLADVEKYIYENIHLPEIPSAEEFRQNDMNVSEMSNKLLQKIEELTLYAIEQDKKTALQQQELERLKTENDNYRSLAERLTAIENELKK
jgi:uncharacterized protein YaiE (UPF0345 family)